MIGQCHEVEDEFLNTSTSTIEDGETEEESKNNYNTDTSTHTLVDEENDDETPERRLNESSSPSSEHSSLSATTDDEEECDERASHLMSLPSKRRRIMEPGKSISQIQKSHNNLNGFFSFGFLDSHTSFYNIASLPS